MSKAPMLYRLFAILGLWVLSGASAFASPGAACANHTSPSPARHAVVQASYAPDVLAVAKVPTKPLGPQARSVPISRIAEAPSLADADEDCGSCVQCGLVV